MKCEFEDCGSTFSDSSALARHRKTHSGLRPHACAVPSCGKAFTRRTTLNQHVIIAHKGTWGETGAKKRRTDDEYENEEEEIMDREIRKSVKSLTSLLARARGDEDGGQPSTSAGPSSGRGEPLESRVAAISANIAAAIVQAQKRIAEENDEEDDEMDSDDDAEMDVLGPLVSGIRDELLRPARREAEGSNPNVGGSALMNAIASVEGGRNGDRQSGVENDVEGIDFAVPLRERRAGVEDARGARRGQKRKR